MLRIAIIADIHANLVALETVLVDLDRTDPDQIICLGDVAVTGPQPREALTRLRHLGCPVVMGNGDDWLLDPRPYPEDEENSRRFSEMDLWCAGQLAPDDLDYVRTFLPTIELPLGAGASLLCFHGSPKSNTDIITATTPDDDLGLLLGGFRATVLAGGHTHAQLLRRYRDMVLVNPGSVGLPYEHDAVTNEDRNPPWAEYGLINWSEQGFSVELRRVPLDAGAVVRAALESGMPHAEWWAASWQTG